MPHRQLGSPLPSASVAGDTLAAAGASGKDSAAKFPPVSRGEYKIEIYYFFLSYESTFPPEYLFQHLCSMLREGEQHHSLSEFWGTLLCELDESDSFLQNSCFLGEISPGRGSWMWGRFAAGIATWSGLFVLVSVSWPSLSSNFASTITKKKKFIA